MNGLAHSLALQVFIILEWNAADVREWKNGRKIKLRSFYLRFYYDWSHFGPKISGEQSVL